MPDQVNQGGDQGNQNQQVPGWISGLPDDLKGNETFKQYKTVGDFAKAHIETATKAKELEGKLTNSIPKLSADATPDQKDAYYKAIGRPEKPDEYELPDDGKNSPEMMTWAKKTFHAAGLSKETASLIGGEWNKFVGAMVQAHNDGIKAEVTEAANKLKTELGDKYDASVELASRLWKKHSDSDFDKVFNRETNQNRFQMVRFLLKIAKLIGEDISPKGGTERGNQDRKPGTFNYDKTPPVNQG